MKSSACLPLLLMPFFLTILLLYWMLRSRLARLVVDHPEHRSLHETPVPRTGGLAIIAALLITGIIFWEQWLLPFAVGAVALTVLSFADDVRSLSPLWRLFCHFVVAIAFLITAMPLTSGWILVLLSFVMVWMINLYNFMDGSDGLAGGMALFGFGAYAGSAWLAGDHQLAFACWAIMSSAAAFLLFNFHPARIFMGDGGSIPLGFLAATVGLYGWQRELWPIWFPLLVFSPFIVDATATLVKRLLRGEKIWQAHRDHYYQRLVQMGWGHRKTAIAEYLLMLVTATSSVLLLHQPAVAIYIVLSFWIMLYLLFMWLVDKR